MQSRKPIHILVSLLTILVSFPVTAFAQEPVSKAALDEWFYSRLLWGVLVGVIVGGSVGLVHLCRLPFQRGLLNINNKARRRFGLFIILIIASAAVLLFMDAWLVFSFRENISMSFGEAFTQVWLNYRMLMILIATASMFTLAVAVTTRLKSDCHCRYAFLPGPRGK